MGEAHYVLGLVQRDLDQGPAARKSLEEAARARRRVRRRRVKRWPMSTCRTAITRRRSISSRLSPPSNRAAPIARWPSAWRKARAGRGDAAVVTLGRALERFPDAPQVYAALGHVWLIDAERRDDRVALNKAIGALQHAAGRADATSETYAELGRALMLAGDHQAAERALRQSGCQGSRSRPEAYLRPGRDHRARRADRGCA
jgi:tetratricopeptide (TPR) repeat protein